MLRLESDTVLKHAVLGMGTRGIAPPPHTHTYFQTLCCYAYVTLNMYCNIPIDAGRE